MHDLRKKALLESGKTTSRKARSRPESTRGSTTHSPVTSPGHSRPGSRANSRPGSRYASEDEGFSDSEYDETMTMSTNSASDDAADGEPRQSWVERLQDRIAELDDRKRSSVQGRTGLLAGYLHLIRHHFAGPQIEGSVSEIVDTLLKSIKGGGSAEERSLALKSLTVTALNCPAESIFEQAFEPLKVVCHDAQDEEVKVDAIYAMAVAAIYCSGFVAAAEDLLEFLMDIIESDGNVVEAEDSGPVVAAALQAWGFVAGQIEDLSDWSEEAMDAFIEQLQSTDIDVQTSAGSNVAFLLEVSRDQEEETGEALNFSYNSHGLMQRLNELARGSKSISKKDRRHVRTELKDVIQSIEEGVGPGYSTVLYDEVNPRTPGNKADGRGGKHLGYRKKLRVRDDLMLIDTWSLNSRAETLRLLLGGGFGTHCVDNPHIINIFGDAEVETLTKEALPKKSPRKASKKKGGRIQDY
ncbi:uncharacterized protein E0L32_005373 [Thyridium curvatum]|uniref:Interferon-related developmental regulator N-terminal domain-containing protein n=1 Tax=Thyridium curvatum TaxID=1093900 RepID=A0A507BAK5_9PEZI|nr:uncharacterized protein E0L32_005373 [Thyridium curvatum]TPX14409.1 hypothetical protein E0L32_005373 [Thyridium curvatum]